MYIYSFFNTCGTNAKNPFVVYIVILLAYVRVVLKVYLFLFIFSGLK